jgi:hypothetical protein
MYFLLLKKGVDRNSPVRIVYGAVEPIAATKFLKVHLNAYIVSSVSRTPANMML